jgi:hypothetical protein
MDVEFDDVHRLLTRSAGKRSPHFWTVTGSGFVASEMPPASRMENAYGQIIYNDRTMRQLYLVSFMAWRALRAYSGLIVLLELRRERFDLRAISDLPSQRDVRRVRPELDAIQCCQARSGQRLNLPRRF